MSPARATMGARVRGRAPGSGRREDQFVGQPLRWSERARAVREEAARRAAALGHGHVDGGHVLLALAALPGAAKRLLAERGVEAQALERAVADTYDGPARIEGEAPELYGYAAKALWETAEELAEADAALELVPAHLFLAATEEPRAHGYRALRALGLEVGPLRDAVAARVRDEIGGLI